MGEERFEITAFDEDGNRFVVTLAAKNQLDAVKMVALRGLHEVRVRRLREAGAAPSRGIALADFNRELAAIIDAGIPLEAGIAELGRDLTRGALRDALEVVARDVAAGVPLDESIRRRQDVFPPAYIRLVAAGLASGSLSDVLRNYADDATDMLELERDVRQALFYPAVVMILLIGVSVCALVFFIPFVQGVFESYSPRVSNVQVKAFFRPMRILLECVIVVLGIIQGLWIVLAIGRKLSSGLASAARAITSRLPLVGRMLRELARVRFFSSLAEMIEREVALPEALELSGDISMDIALAADAYRMADEVRAGRSLVEAVEGKRTVSRSAAWLIQAGGQHGELGDAFRELARISRDSARATAEKIRIAVTPVAIIFAGAAISAVGLTFYLGLYKIIWFME